MIYNFLSVKSCSKVICFLTTIVIIFFIVININPSTLSSILFDDGAYAYFNINNNISGIKICNSKINLIFPRSEFVNSSLLKSHPNIPKFLLSIKKSSSLLPLIQSIRWTGIHWQESEKIYPKFLLYSAHFDNYRFNEGLKWSYIYILGLYDGEQRPDKYFCQLYFNESSPVFALPVISYVLVDWQGFSSNYLVPYLLTCSIPNQLDFEHLPVAVSLVKTSCEVPSNLLQITGVEEHSMLLRSNKTNRTSISVAVCGPALYYFNEDFSIRLIEWIELLNSIGVAKIILYKTSVHTNVEKVLNYYENRGLVTIISFHYPPPYLDDPILRRLWTQSKRRELFALENVYFTDCVLRFKDKFDYLAHIDPDEIIILKKHKTLGELMHYLRSLNEDDSLPTSFGLKWKVFYSDISPGKRAQNISETFYILRHNRRISKLINNYDDNVKSIYDTSRVRAVYSHKPILYLGGSTHGKTEIVSPEIAYTAHFRSQSCGIHCFNIKFVEENSLIEKSKEIISRIKVVLKKLQLN